MHRLRLPFSFAVLALIALGSATPAADPAIKVGFVSNNSAEFWTIAEAGAKKAAKETGVQLAFRRPAKGEAAVQKEIIDTLLLQGVKALAVSVIDPPNQLAYLDGVAAKVPLITQDNDVPKGKRLCYIGTDNYEAGKAVGKMVKEALPEGGAIAIFVGQLEPLNARERRQGVLDELAGQKNAKGKTFGKYKLLGTYTDDTNGQKAKDNATDVLSKNRDEQNLCMIGLWAYNPPAILSAVKSKGREGQVKIIGFDEDFDTLTGIAQGHVYGTVVQDPFGFGYESVKLMAALAQGDKSGLPADGVRYVPHRIITKTGGDGRIAVEKFQADLKAILSNK